MFNIEKYLNKFSKTLESTEDIKNKIVEIIKNNTGIDVPVESIEIKDFYLQIKTTPIVLNKIFIYKEKILEESTKATNINLKGIR